MCTSTIRSLHPPTSAIVAIFKHIIILWICLGLVKNKNKNKQINKLTQSHNILSSTLKVYNQFDHSLTKCPIISFTFTTTFSWNFYEAFIERQVVSYGVLPAFFVLFKIRETLCYVRIYFTQCRTFCWSIL